MSQSSNKSLTRFFFPTRIKSAGFKNPGPFSIQEGCCVSALCSRTFGKQLRRVRPSSCVVLWVPDWSHMARSVPPAFPSNASFMFCCSAWQLTKHMRVHGLSLVTCQVNELDSVFSEVFSEVFSSSSSSLVWWCEWFSVIAAAAVCRHSLSTGHNAHSKEEEN